jgi:hypothetical protein
MTHEALFTKGQLLAAGAHRDRALHVAEVGKGHPQIERRPERWARRADRLAADPRVLCLHDEGDVAVRGNRRAHAEAAQPVQVVARLHEAGVHDRFHALAELAAEPEPRREHFVDRVGGLLGKRGEGAAQDKRKQAEAARAGRSRRTGHATLLL